MKDIIRLNDWRIRECIVIIITLQLILWGAICLDLLHIKVPILRQFIGFIYLIYVPGILILRILRLHKLDRIETLLYSVGLSIATWMFLGALLNSLCPILGGAGPISLWPLMAVSGILTAILCIIAYLRDADFSATDSVYLQSILSPPSLILYSFPILSILGTYLVNSRGNSIIIYILLIILSLMIILFGFDKFVGKDLYPLAVFVIAISLLYHNSLISSYIWGWDIFTEYHFADLVSMNSIWDSTIESNINAMLSIVILAPIFAIVCDIDFTWVFKIIYPFLFSLTALGLYRIYQRQIDDKLAFASIFFFMSLQAFFVEMLQLPRQEIAELFVVLLISLLISKEMDDGIRNLLFLVFSYSLVVSHYGSSYIFGFSLILGYLMLNLKGNRNIITPIRKAMELSGNWFYSASNSKRSFTGGAVLLFIIFSLSWYMYISNSSNFDLFARIMSQILGSLLSDFLDPDASQGLDIILSAQYSSAREIAKYLHILTIIFIVIGLMRVISDQKGLRFEDEYIALSIVYMIIALAGIVVPFLAGQLNTSRLYQTCLIFLAPFSIIGLIKVSSFFCRYSAPNRILMNSLKIFSVILALLLLLDSGVVFEVTGEPPSSFSLSPDEFVFLFVDERDLACNQWLRNMNAAGPIYGDLFEVLSSIAYGRFSEEEVRILDPRNTIIEGNYIYIRSGDVIFREKDIQNAIYKTFSQDFIKDMNKIYNNECLVYKR